MHDESLRQDQISAANKFLSFLDPRKIVDGNVIRKGPMSLDYAPSVVAASAVLDSKRPR